MTLKQLTYFLTVAKHESFTNASKELFVCQSALSKSIKTLEFELGIKLIDRTSRKFKLSLEGNILYENGSRTLSNINQNLETLVDSLSTERGKLKVGVPPVISTIYFTSIASKFRSLFPNIDLNVSEEGANSVKDLVAHGEVDIGVVILPFDSDAFDVYPVFTGDCVAVLNKKHPLAGEEALHIKDLKDDNFVILNSSYMLYNKIFEFCKSSDFTPHVVSTSSQWDYVTETVATNIDYVTILPRLIVEKYNSKNIKLIPFKYPSFLWNVALIIRKDKYKSKVIKSFIEFCQSEGKLFF